MKNEKMLMVDELVYKIEKEMLFLSDNLQDKTGNQRTSCYPFGKYTMNGFIIIYTQIYIYWMKMTNLSWFNNLLYPSLICVNEYILRVYILIFSLVGVYLATDCHTLFPVTTQWQGTHWITHLLYTHITINDTYLCIYINEERIHQFKCRRKKRQLKKISWVIEDTIHKYSTLLFSK